MTDFLDSNLTNKGIKETIKLAFINFQNYLILFLLEFVTNFDGFIAVLYTLGVTIGIKAMIMLGCFFGLDQIDTFLRKLTGSAPKDLYSVTWVDRGFAFLASAWTMGELFTYNPFIVRQYALLGYIDQNFLRGVSYFINLHPLNSTIFSFFVFREVIRRRGPDTKWFGETKKFWIKNIVRYHWCFAFCLNAIIQTYMYGVYKFLIPQGLPMAQQESMAIVSFSIAALIISYSGICALFGLRCQLPLFHGACTIHVGKLKNEEDESMF